MNGTVTIQTVVSGVEANSFEEATERVVALLDERNLHLDDEHKISYRKGNKFLDWLIPERMPIVGRMSSDPLHMLE